RMRVPDLLKERGAHGGKAMVLQESGSRFAVRGSRFANCLRPLCRFCKSITYGDRTQLLRSTSSGHAAERSIVWLRSRVSETLTRGRLEYVWSPPCTRSSRNSQIRSGSAL